VSARYLLCCWPFPGHVNPNVAVAHALRERGHEVAFYTGEEARATIEREGFEVHGFERVAAAWEPVRELEQRASGQRGKWRAQTVAFRAWLIGTVKAQVEDLEPIVERWQPDVLVSEPAMLGPITVLSETSGRPVAALATFMGTLIPGPDAPIAFGLGLPPARRASARLAKGVADRVVEWGGARFRAGLDEVRAEHGLAPLPCSINAFAARLPLFLVGNLAELDYARRDLPPSVHYVGPCSWQPADDATDAAWLDELSRERPWVHVTEGTSNARGPFLLRAAARGLAGAPLEAVLTTGHRDPATLGLDGVAANVHVAQFLNHADLLPRCALIVTTGGAGTILAAALAGTPQLVVPTVWDQPDNGRRLIEAGVGRVLSERRCTPARLRDAVEGLLADDGARSAAARLGARLRARGGPQRAAELLEDLVHHNDNQGGVGARAAVASAPLTRGKELA